MASAPLTVHAGPLRASVEVNATALEDEAEAVQRQVADQGQAVLRDADVLPNKGDGGIIHVELARLDPGPGYAWVVWAERGAQELDGTRADGECEGCSAYDLSLAVAGAIEGTLGPLREAEDAASEPEPPPVQTPPADDPSDARIRIGGLGIGGIVVMAAGIGLIGGGAALLARGRELSPDPNDPSMLAGSDFRPPGGALLALGAAAVITGAVVLAVAVKKGKSARAKQAAVVLYGLGLRF